METNIGAKANICTSCAHHKRTSVTSVCTNPEFIHKRLINVIDGRTTLPSVVHMRHNDCGIKGSFYVQKKGLWENLMEILFKWDRK